jgi:exopolyphosphatase / guanosine-5'-triphosphate,3'-diphosphate pyrophosphatase
MMTVQRMQAVQNVMRSYEDDEAHVQQVCRLAMLLFDQLQPLHGVATLERDWLEAGALLHDIGWSQAGQAHHKASLQLIIEENMPGWRKEEQLAIANIARYHRKSTPKAKHRYFAQLAQPLQETVKRLAALLRLADGLDCGHDSCVTSIASEISDREVTLYLILNRDETMVQAGMDKKKDLFEDLFGKKIILRSMPH